MVVVVVACAYCPLSVKCLRRSDAMPMLGAGGRNHAAWPHPLPQPQMPRHGTFHLRETEGVGKRCHCKPAAMPGKSNAARSSHAASLAGVRWWACAVVAGMSPPKVSSLPAIAMCHVVLILQIVVPK